MSDRLGPRGTARIPRIGGETDEPLSIPHRYETMPLRLRVRLAGWVVGAAAAVGAFVIADRVDGAAGDVGSAVTIILGCAALVAVVVCRRYEILVATKRIDVGTGPFRGVVPTGAVESAARRPAVGWRRLYADTEVEIRYTLGRGRVVVPSRAPDLLLTALDELR